MFSSDDFLVRLSSRAGAYPAANINPANTPRPLAMAAREDLGALIMTTYADNILGYLDYVWANHNQLQNDLADPTRNPPYTLPNVAPTGPLGEAMRDAFDEVTYYQPWHAAAAPPALQAQIAALAGEPVAPGFGCYHLIFAFMIEQTRAAEAMHVLLRRFNNGEKIGIASPASRQWLAVTEALFYRQTSAHDHAPASTITSDTRDDGRALRRNAYYRMFGMDLSHGTEDNKPYPYEKPKASNREFVGVFEALLRELWVAIANVSNFLAENPTDNAEIANLARRLRVMLQNRRINSTLTREEFSAVLMMDWIRLAVSFNSPLVLDLRAEAESEYERLKKISERIELPIHSKSDEYFQLAAPLAGLLIGIENQTLNNTAAFLAYPGMADIINNWSKATGKALKKMPRQVSTGSKAA